MKKTFIVLLFGALIGNSLEAQDVNTDPIVMEIGDEKITQSEFLKNFRQANSVGDNATADQKRKALNEYVDLFVNFRLKIKEALAERYDTVPSFVEEYSTYRNELAAPYLIDSKLLEEILQEVYRRNQQAVRASHIMVALPRNPSPDDTLKAYQKAMDIYEQAIKKGADFKKLAIALSEDPSAKDHVSPTSGQELKGNGGDLGYFTVFDMVYPFEEAAFTMEVGEVSKPVRSNFGYHIIKLVDKISIYGKSSIQHIWVGSMSDKDENRMMSRINDAYRRLSEGEDFNKVVRDCSEDRATIPVNGLIEDVPVQRMVPEYVSKIAELKVGEFSKPFKTDFGWHIIKVVKKDTIAPFEDMKPFYKQRISRDQRSKQPQNVFVENMKEKYGFIDYTSKNKQAFDELLSALTDSVFRGTWEAPQLKNGEMMAFSFADNQYTVNDLAKYIEETQKKSLKKYKATYLKEQFDALVGREIIAYANAGLEKDYPEFNELVKDYRNGLLIFAYNDEKVWSKAIIDTTGLKEFYALESKKHDISNPDESIYFWKQRADVMTISVFDSNCIDAAKAMKVVEKNAFKEGMTKDKMYDLLMKKLKKKKCTIDPPMYIRNVKVEKDNNEVITPEQFKKGIYSVKTTNGKGYIIIVVKGLIEPTVKDLRDARGYYINDYQAYLEKQLVENLRNKYKITVYRDIIDKITF
ncbi:MAG: peptidylprolyl isomerase [Bacteroidales bacterium]|nr:peptidylprolyl isomerase [Bacteroidales bacterium]